MIPSVKQYIKKCEEFFICADSGDKGAVGVEYSDQRRGLYNFIVKGSVSFNTINGSTLTQEIYKRDNGLINVKHHLNNDLILRAEEDFYIIGFSCLEKTTDWEGEIKTGSFTGTDNSWLIIFDGNPVINGQTLQRYDYAKLENKLYDVTLNDGVIAVFKKL